MANVMQKTQGRTFFDWLIATEKQIYLVWRRSSILGFFPSVRVFS